LVDRSIDRYTSARVNPPSTSARVNPPSRDKSISTIQAGFSTFGELFIYKERKRDRDILVDRSIDRYTSAIYMNIYILHYYPSRDKPIGKIPAGFSTFGKLNIYVSD